MTNQLNNTRLLGQVGLGPGSELFDRLDFILLQVGQKALLHAEQLVIGGVEVGKVDETELALLALVLLGLNLVLVDLVFESFQDEDISKLVDRQGVVLGTKVQENMHVLLFRLDVGVVIEGLVDTLDFHYVILRIGCFVGFCRINHQSHRPVVFQFRQGVRTLVLQRLYFRVDVEIVSYLGLDKRKNTI